MRTFTLLLLFLFTIPLSGQKRTPWQATVYDGKQGKKAADGILFEAGDSSLVLVKSLRVPVETEIRAVDISYLKLRKEGNTARGALVGAGIGLAGGFAFGLLTRVDTGNCSPDDDWCEFWSGLGKAYNAFYVTFTGAVGAGAGAATGALVGSASTRIDIGFSLRKYREQKKKLEELAWRKGF